MLSNVATSNRTLGPIRLGGCAVSGRFHDLTGYRALTPSVETALESVKSVSLENSQILYAPFANSALRVAEYSNSGTSEYALWRSTIMLDFPLTVARCDASMIEWLTK